MRGLTRSFWGHSTLAACVLAGGVTAVSAAYAGAWTETEDQGRAIVTLRGSLADDSFDANGNSAPAPKFRKEETDVYIAYGVRDGTTLIVHPDYVNLHPEAPSVHATGWGETELGVLQRLWQDGPQILSVQGSALLPGDSALTSGGVDWEARALYGYSFELFGLPAYADLELAYRWRAKGYADQLRPELTLGLWANDDLLLMAQSFNVITTTSGANQYFAGEQQKAQLSALYKLDQFVGLQFGGFATLGGRTTPAERGIFAALWLDF